MKKRIMAFILSGCMLLQSPGFTSWAAETPVYTQTDTVNGIAMSGTESAEIMQTGSTEAAGRKTTDNETEKAEYNAQKDVETFNTENSEVTDSETTTLKNGEKT